MLYHYNRRPQDSWPIDTITINGMIAILATICRSAFMAVVAAVLAQTKWNWFSGQHGQYTARLADFALFDNAARGPFGSAQLIWRFKGGHLACIGAALSILSAAFSLFSQQLISLRIDVVRQNIANPARVTWAQSSIGTALLSSTKSAIYNGFMARTIGDPQAYCPTANCTWPIVPTVGVCGACVDLTFEIYHAGKRGGSDCWLRTPGGLWLSNPYCDWEGQSGPIFNISNGTGQAFSSYPFMLPKNAPNVIANFGAMGLPPKVTDGSTTINKSVAVDCGLWYCVQAHNISVRLGELHDEVVETWSKARVKDFLIRIENISFVDIPSSFNTDPGESYGLDLGLTYHMRQYLNDTIWGSIKKVNFPSNLQLPFITFEAQSDYAEGMHNGLDNIHAWVGRLAKSMTNDLRLNSTYPSAESERFQGTAMTNQVIIVVRWQWIVFPTVLVLLSIVHLGIEMVRTRRIPNVRPWKEESLLPLCVDIDDEIREKAREGITEPGGIEKRVGHYFLNFRGF
ncbi:hypothetical protein B0T10DRAFT_541469 [Thelonectria olida]|uniref:Uncharacterized protein n=1 Tax=Thelonectria olida TaxID=1576542 RepID=A0A9P8VQ27_9HYPO|nr:hypothetical protein B0T10DRAFT_541469 [Thelonectria olida]